MHDEDEAHGKKVIMVQDLEEKWEQKFLRFKAAPRITGTAWSSWWVRTPRLFASSKFSRMKTFLGLFFVCFKESLDSVAALVQLTV